MRVILLMIMIILYWESQQCGIFLLLILYLLWCGKSDLSKEFDQVTSFNIPKLLIIASRYPIYSEMKNFLYNIINRIFSKTKYSVESMILNLIWDLPFPESKYRIKTDFWKMNLPNQKQRNWCIFERTESISLQNESFKLKPNEVILFYIFR